jgi:hypothetical protein
MDGDGKSSMMGSKEEASISSVPDVDAWKYSSFWGTEMISMTILEARMEARERDEGWWMRDCGRFGGRGMSVSFTCTFDGCRMPFKNGTERLLRRVPKKPLLSLGGVFCHFG